MQFLENHFEVSDLIEIIKLARFVEKYEVLTVKNEIKTVQGNILIQNGRNLTENLVKSLQARTDLAKDIFIIQNSENLKMSIVNRIHKEYLKKMDLSDYSFCAFLINKNPLDFRRILRGSLNNGFFLGFLTDLFMNNYEILPHLIEVSLTSIGLLSNTKDDEIDYSDYIKLFQASILHDFTLTKDRQWQKSDSFENDNNHDRESAMSISDKNLPPDISEIILAHNKLQVKYINNSELKWYGSKLELLIGILNLSEYYTYIKRLRQENLDNEMAIVLYQLSLITEKGYFPLHLLGLFEAYFSKYSKIFKYGQQIGKIEGMCVKESKIAAAYPKPRSTQLLCKNSTIPCEHRIYNLPLKVVTDKKIGSSIFEVLTTGWYDKCKFAIHLPDPPEI
ncbi:MAG: hypothetical protein OEV78_10440 [Spirochaetia bacterium]|nr:hypothetical protein [Spirochaetia bacterium]